MIRNDELVIIKKKFTQGHQITTEKDWLMFDVEEHKQKARELKNICRNDELVIANWKST